MTMASFEGKKEKRGSMGKCRRGDLKNQTADVRGDGICYSMLDCLSILRMPE